MTRTKKQSTDFAEYIRARLAKDTELASAVEEARIAADIAEEIYQARIEAGLTQTQLAEKVGTHQSVIARLEDADYSGHTITMLRRIASATGMRLGVGFYAQSVPFQDSSSSTFTPEWGEGSKWNLKAEAASTSLCVSDAQ